jgi:hypothetical protein
VIAGLGAKLLGCDHAEADAEAAGLSDQNFLSAMAKADDDEKISPAFTEIYPVWPRYPN